METSGRSVNKLYSQRRGSKNAYPLGNCFTCLVPVAEFIGEAFTVAVASAITYVAGKSAVDASKKLPAVEFDPAKSSGPLLMSSFGSSSFANIAETNGAKAQ